MNYNSKKDLERLGDLTTSMTEMIEGAEGREMSKDEQVKLDNLIDEHTNLEKSIQTKTSAAEKIAKQGERVEQIAERQAKPVEQFLEEKEDFRSAFNQYLRKGGQGLTPKQYETLTRAQSSGTDSEGGFTVDEVIADEIYTQMANYGGMRSVCDVIRTSTGGVMNFVTNNDTGNVGEWLAENSAASAQDTVFANKSLNAWKASSDYMLLSRELIQDSKFDIIGYISGLIAERIGRLTNTAYTAGSGSSQPNGVRDASLFGAATDVTAVVDFDDLLDLKHSVDRDYRALGSHWMMNDTVLRDLKKASIASANQSLWQPGIIGGEPSTIDGDPYVINNDLPDIAAGSHSVLYGAFSKYVIRDVTGIEILRSDELNMLKNQITFVGFMRTDGDLIDTNAVKHLRTDNT